MEWIENQPVFFGDSDECSTDEMQVQLVDNTDTTQVQFTFTPCEDTLVPIGLTDPAFTPWNHDDNWVMPSVAGGDFCSDGSGLGTVQVYSGYVDNDFIVGGNYIFNITATVTSGGVNVYLGGTLLGTITVSGTHTFSGVCTNSITYGTHLYFSVISADSVVCISPISAFGNKLINNIILAVYDINGVYQNELSVNSNPDNFVFSNNTVTISIDWSDLGLSNGCFYLCLLDPCENTNGQNVQADISLDEADWLMQDWTYSAGVFTGSYVLGNYLIQNNVFETYSDYCVEFTVQNLTGTVNVYFGETLAGSITDNGVSTITGVPSGNFNLVIYTTEGTYVEITDISACGVSPDDYVCNKQSNIFKLADYSNECTLLINACNNEDGLGFVFNNTGFTPTVRLEAKLRQPKYVSERSIYDDSLGKRKVVYFSGRKQKTLCIDRQPEYIHDFLRLLPGFDNVRINNVLYSVDDDEYNVEYNEADDSTGSVKLLVSKRTQNLKNINVSDVENVCNLPPHYLLQADDLTQNITLTDGQLILING